MDALENGDLVIAQLEGLALNIRAHLPGELKLGNQDLLPPVQGGKVLVEQVHVHAEGGLVVDLPLPVPGRCLRVHGLEIVVHADGVGVDAHLLQLGLDLLGGGGLAAAGWAGEQDDPGFGQVVRDLPGRGLDLPVVGLVALLRKALGVAADGVVDLTE